MVISTVGSGTVVGTVSRSISGIQLVAGWNTIAAKDAEGNESGNSLLYE